MLVLVFSQRGDVHQSFGRQLQALYEQTEIFYPGYDRLHLHANVLAEVA